MSKIELLTVREMIDAAIIIDSSKVKDPKVDFNMLEAIFYIIATHLNVLQRKVRVRYEELKQAKMLKKKKLAVTQIKIHGKSDKKTKDRNILLATATQPKILRKTARQTKEYSLTESTTDNSPSYPKTAHHRKARNKSKSRSRSKSVDKSRKQRRRSKGERTDTDVLHEKLLIVSRTSQERDHRSSIVTQEQYKAMLSEVQQLQKKFGLLPTDGKSGQVSLHRPTSLTDARAALNMSTRLEASHKKLNEMLVVVTNLASGIPSMNLNGPFDDIFIHKLIKDTPATSVTAQLSSSNGLTTGITESEEVLADAEIDDENLQVEEIDIENLATWPELKVNMDNIRNNTVTGLSETATFVTNRAKKASALFKESGPKLSEASILNVKFARLRILCDSFNNKINAFDVKMAQQVTDCQETVSEFQFTVETIIERIENCLANPAEDPVAVALIKQDFAEMQLNLSAAKNNQTTLTENQDEFDANLKKIQKMLAIINGVKTTKGEAVEAFKNKANLIDVNGLLSVVQLSAIVGFIQKEILRMNDHIESGETEWQLTIDELMLYLREKCDRVQVKTLNNSLRYYYESMAAEVNTMLNIVGDFRVSMYEKKLDRDGNCLSCGSPADVKVSDTYMNVAKCMLNQQAVKPTVTPDHGAISIPPCVPGRPIPHPLDPRALVCDRYCGATLNKSDESLSSSLGLDVTDINPSYLLAKLKKTVHISCTPCTHSEETLYK